MRKFCMVILATLSMGMASAQDVAFSQYYDQPFQRNPALAGIFTGDIRATASFRNQWQSVTVPYRTYGISGEIKMPLDFVADDNLTVGLQLLGDKAGTSQYSTYQIMPTISYSLPLSTDNNSYLSLAFMGGLREQRFDPTALILNDQFLGGSNGTFSIRPSSTQVFGKTSTNSVDISTGLSYNGAINNVDYYVGAGMFHLNSPQIGFFDKYDVVLHKKLAFNFGLAAPVGEVDQLRVYGDYFRQYDGEFKPTGVNTFQAGLMYSRSLFVDGEDEKALVFGALYRLEDAVIPVVKLELPRFAFGVSYDVNVSKLVKASQSRGGFEFTISYKNFLNYRNSDLRQSACPRFGR